MSPKKLTPHLLPSEHVFLAPRYTRINEALYSSSRARSTPPCFTQLCGHYPNRSTHRFLVGAFNVNRLRSAPPRVGGFTANWRLQRSLHEITHGSVSQPADRLRDDRIGDFVHLTGGSANSSVSRHADRSRADRIGLVVRLWVKGKVRSVRLCCSPVRSPLPLLMRI